MATAGGGRETAGTHLDDAVAVARRLSNVQWVHVRPPRPWQTHAPPPAPPPTSVRAGRDTARPRGPAAVVAVSVPTGGGPKKQGRGCRTANDTPAGVPASRRPAAAPPPPRRRGGEQTGKRIKQRVGGRRRPRHRLGHTHPTRPPRPTLSPLRCVTVAPERGGGADERQRGERDTPSAIGHSGRGGAPPPQTMLAFSPAGVGGSRRGRGGRSSGRPWGPHPRRRAPHHATGPLVPPPPLCGAVALVPPSRAQPGDQPTPPAGVEVQGTTFARRGENRG